MPSTLLVGILLILSAIGYYMGRSRSISSADGRIASLHSVPSYYGFYVMIWAGVPALLLLLVWTAVKGSVIEAMVLNAISREALAGWAVEAVPTFTPDELRQQVMDQGIAALSDANVQLLLINLRNIAAGAEDFVNSDVVEFLRPAAEYYAGLNSISSWLIFAICMALASGALYYTQRQINPRMRARNRVEFLVTIFLLVCSCIAIATTIGIVLSLLFESMRFFSMVPPHHFLFGLEWSPQIALRADQAGSSGAFGMIPLFAGTLLIATIAMLVAVPLGLMAAIYMADYAPRKVRAWAKPILEILAGVPTVVFGFFAILVVAPVVRDVGAAVGLDVSSNSALAAGLVMGIMIVPFVSSLSDDVINAVPQSLRDGSAGMGATKSETIRLVVLPAALPGIVGACLLAASRAIGETMIVVMAAGLAANITANPFEAVTTVTVQIASLLVGDQEFDSPKTLSVFALGLVLFVVTLCLNVIALRVVQKYREKYD